MLGIVFDILLVMVFVIVSGCWEWFSIVLLIIILIIVILGSCGHGKTLGVWPRVCVCGVCGGVSRETYGVVCVVCVVVFHVKHCVSCVRV